MVRFDKPCTRVDGAVNYFREHLRVGDYLTEEGKAEMVWFGGDAARLGLNGPCELDALARLCAGLHPTTGSKLGVRDKGPNRRVCFFGQVSAPKDVSIALLVGGDQRIVGWWQEAVQETLHEIEAATATRVRRGGANADRETGGMVAAVVTHDSSRALDPQLHTHVCIMNLTYDLEEKRWKGVQPSGYFRHQGYFREICYNRLAQRMLAAGYEIEPQRAIGFTIKGFPPQLREAFSERRKTILREAAARGATSQDELQAITAETRAAKVRTTARELRSKWEQRAGDDLAAVRAVIASADGTPKPAPSRPAAEAIASADAHVFERRSVVDARTLLRESLRAARGEFDLETHRTELGRRIGSGALLRINDAIGSPAALADEQAIVEWANLERDTCARLGRIAALDSLGADQAAAVADVLGTRSRVVILQGDAGTGKTTCLKSIVAGVERAGGRVFGCAPSAGATDVLRRELTPAADTLQQLLANPALQETTRGSVLLVDEAGLISGRQMRALCQLAAANGNRLVLIGDTKQHASVEAGDALRCLQEFALVPVAHLTQIRRQKDPAYRAAVALLARGDALGAFDQFAQLGSVCEDRNPRRLFARAAEDYVETVRAGKSCLVISPVWAEIHAITADVRARLKSAGLVAQEERQVQTVVPLQWTREDRRRVKNYQPGDVLTFHRADGGFARGDFTTVVRRDDTALTVSDRNGREARLDPKFVGGFEVGLASEIGVAVGDRLLLRANHKPSRLKNGDLVEVAGFAADGGIELQDGRTLPATFRQFSHGYATTSHSAQGKTVDRGILLMADEGIAAGNLHQAYVSNSRFRESQMIYASDAEAAREAMQRPGDRLLVSEIVSPPPAKKSSYRRSFLWRLAHTKIVNRGAAMLRGWPDVFSRGRKVAAGRT